MDLYNLRYPIGEYEPNKNPDSQTLKKWIDEIEAFPSELKEAIKEASVEQLNHPYRPDGWKVKQVVHHVADSHLNCLLRLKLILTEDTPEIRPYFEDRWAKLADAETEDFTVTLALLEAVHQKIVFLLKRLDSSDLQRLYYHPEYRKKMNLAEMIGNYAWHGKHHLAHVMQGLQSQGKYR